MKALIDEKHNDRESSITVKVSQRTQKVKIYVANEGSGLALFSTDLAHVFGSNVGNKFGVMLRGKGPQEPETAYDIISIHSIIYTDPIEYNVVGDTKTPLLLSFL